VGLSVLWCTLLIFCMRNAEIFASLVKVLAVGQPSYFSPDLARHYMFQRPVCSTSAVSLPSGARTGLQHLASTNDDARTPELTPGPYVPPCNSGSIILCILFIGRRDLRPIFSPTVYMKVASRGKWQASLLRHLCTGICLLLWLKSWIGGSQLAGREKLNWRSHRVFSQERRFMRRL
jgi:hypothetical protein